ncbi:MAG: hypothetical protein ACQEQI_00425 [Bacillota bacterium]
MLINLILIVSGLIISYNLGYYYGKRRGIKRGKELSALELREESLTKGYCLLCNGDKNEEFAGDK